jgi:hypothetical protein
MMSVDGHPSVINAFGNSLLYKRFNANSPIVDNLYEQFLLLRWIDD